MDDEYSVEEFSYLYLGSALPFLDDETVELLLALLVKELVERGVRSNKSAAQKPKPAE
jgi:hypothetical protein